MRKPMSWLPARRSKRNELAQETVNRRVFVLAVRHVITRVGFVRGFEETNAYGTV